MSFFARNAERMSHPAAAEVFRRLQAEEQLHIEFIQSLLRFLDDAENEEPSVLVPGSDDLFSLRAAAELLDETVTQSMIPDVTVLRTAYLIERDFADYYAMAAQNADGRAREALEALAVWERQHERLFKDWHDRVFELYAEMPWGG